jgi:Flp pilus assembly pilin Flp
MTFVDGYRGMTLAALMKQEDGATMIEYALIASLVALVVIATLSLLAPAISDTLTNITQTL